MARTGDDAEAPVVAGEAPAADRFAREVLRINARYLVEVVEAFNLCPFARAARLGGRVARAVLAAEAPSLDEALAAHDALAVRPEVEIGLLVFPRVAVAPAGWDRFTAALRDREAARRTERGDGGQAPFAFAAFHPGGGERAATPAQMVPFFRRAPDPTIQLVRFAALDAVKGDARSGQTFVFDFSPAAFAELERRTRFEPTSERIARENFETARGEGRLRIEAVLDDIATDRRASYARANPALSDHPGQAPGT